MEPQKIVSLYDMEAIQPELASPSTLPLVGHTRWQELKHFVAFSRETLRRYELEGHFPKRVRFSQRCTGWPNDELQRYFADPENYQSQS